MTDQHQAQDANANEEEHDSTSATEHQADVQDTKPNDFDTLPDWAKREIETLRTRSAKYRTTAKENQSAAEKLKELEDSQKTELQRLEEAKSEWESKYADLESKYRNTIAESAFIDAAREAKARTPHLLARAYKSELEFDEDGKVTNLAAVIEKARVDEPDAFQPTSGKLDGGTTGTVVSDPKDKMNQALRAMAQSAPR